MRKIEEVLGVEDKVEMGFVVTAFGTILDVNLRNSFALVQYAMIDEQDLWLRLSNEE